MLSWQHVTYAVSNEPKMNIVVVVPKPPKGGSKTQLQKFEQ